MTTTGGSSEIFVSFPDRNIVTYRVLGWQTQDDANGSKNQPLRQVLIDSTMQYARFDLIVQLSVLP